MNWAKATFPVVRAPMKKVPWGLLYNKFAEVPQDPKALEARVAKLVADSDVQNITPWRDGGRTVPANCQMLCKECNRRKGAK